MNMIKNCMDELDLKIKEQAATIDRFRNKMDSAQVALEHLLCELEDHRILAPASIKYAKSVIDLLKDETKTSEYNFEKDEI